MAFMPTTTDRDLIVRGESIEATYRNYKLSKYWVNRRYQRKLIWTLDEKQGFIDSIANGYPVPIILLAENTSKETSSLEIIDGMQHLNAVMSFIENDYSLDGSYFDLNTTAVTKELMDAGDITQKTPILDRKICVQIASYPLPFSIYEFASSGIVDEVFRRINSGGRKLSSQELRTAGATGHFAQAVRRIATQVRGDESHADVLPLNSMAAVSITNRDLRYGIEIDNIFWVNQNILTKGQVRESRDEEIIADILSYMLLPSHPSSRSEFFDDYYGRYNSEVSQRRFNEIELAVQKRSIDLVVSDFHRTLDEVKLTFKASGDSFGKLVFEQRPSKAPRYFQIVFLAFYTLIIKENMQVANRPLLISRMTNSSGGIAAPEGGKWGGEDRHKAVQSTAGAYREAFEISGANDPAVIHWITRLENILSQSLTEQSLYDFKQGFLRLDGSNTFDDENFSKIMKTCVGIANNRKGCKGYVLVGVSDKNDTTKRAIDIFGITPNVFGGFAVTGTDHEAKALSKDADNYFHLIIDKLEKSSVSSPLKEYIGRNIKPIRYFDKTVFIFDVEGQEDPSTYNGSFYDRKGTSLKKVDSADIAQFVRRYITGN